MNLFHHQFGQVVQHIGKAVLVGAAPGLDIGQQRLFASIEFDDFGHEAVNRLVIGDPGARRIGNGDPARTVHIHDPRHTEGRIGIEGQRVEVIVIHPAIEHVDRLVSARGAHLHPAIDDAQIAAFDQFRAHLIGEEGVFEIGGIVGAGCQHRDRRLAPGEGGRHAGGQTAGEAARVVRHAFNRDPAEQIGEHPHHRFAVFQHVGHARRRAGVIFEHEEFIRPGAHQINADDVGVDPARRGEADHIGQPRIIGLQQPLGHPARAHDFLPVIEIIQERIERPHPLFDPA